MLAKERPDTKDRRLRTCRRADAVEQVAAGTQRGRLSGQADTRLEAAPHQGWSPDFIPKLTGDAIDMGVISRIVTIAGPDAMKCSRELAQKEGIFVGITAGATFAGALEVCKNAAPGSTVLCMLPDTGERYLSTPLFADVGVDMSKDELEISNSTTITKRRPRLLNLAA